MVASTYKELERHKVEESVEHAVAIDRRIARPVKLLQKKNTHNNWVSVAPPFATQTGLLQRTEVKVEAAGHVFADDLVHVARRRLCLRVIVPQVAQFARHKAPFALAGVFKAKHARRLLKVAQHGRILGLHEPFAVAQHAVGALERLVLPRKHLRERRRAVHLALQRPRHVVLEGMAQLDPRTTRRRIGFVSNSSRGGGSLRCEKRRLALASVEMGGRHGFSLASNQLRATAAPGGGSGGRLGRGEGMQHVACARGHRCLGVRGVQVLEKRHALCQRLRGQRCTTRLWCCIVDMSVADPLEEVALLYHVRQLDRDEHARRKGRCATLHMGRVNFMFVFCCC